MSGQHATRTTTSLSVNRLECMNGKIKSVCSLFVTLDTLLAVLRVLIGERTHSHIMQCIRTQGTPNVALTASNKTYNTANSQSHHAVHQDSGDTKRGADSL